MLNLKKIIADCIIKLKTLGCNIDLADLKTCNFEAMGKTLGYVKIKAKHSYVVCFNEKLSQDSKIDFLLCAIYHELCHVIQFNEAFDNDIVDFDETTGEFIYKTENADLLINTVFGNCYHTSLWADTAKQINKLIPLKIQVKDYLSDEEISRFLEEIMLMKIPKRIKAPIIIKDDVISGFTIDDIENNIYKFNPPEDIDNEAVMDHDSYRKWLKEPNKEEKK